jgi:hypothetical protein
MKRRLVGLAALLLAGCGSITGPFAARKPVRVDDPHVTIFEQQQRGRDRLALPQEPKQVVPQTYGDFARPGSPYLDFTNN